MMDAKRLVAVGHFSPTQDDIACDPAFRDTWQDGAANAVDALPYTVEEIAEMAADYESDILDREFWAHGC